MFEKQRILHVCMFVALVTMVIGVGYAQAIPSYGKPIKSEGMPELLQFVSSGHVLGFQENGVYVLTGSHMLREGFVNTKGVAPQADRMAAKEGRAQPMGKVGYPDLWEGITLTYDRPDGGILRSTYHVEPQSDPDQIGLRYNVPVHLDASGNLVFEFETGTLTASVPVAWQEIEGKRIDVEVAFRLDSSQTTVHFSLGDYNPDFPLFIDPTLTWNTFMGSSSLDKGRAIAVDGSGNVYVAGHSQATWGSPVNDYVGSNDAFVAKLNSGGMLQWNTFMGASNDDYGIAVAVDGTENIYVVGNSYQSWGSPLNAYKGSSDAFVAKLDSSGVSVWNTFLGSTSMDSGADIAVDGSGNVYVAGESDATWGSPLNGYAGGVADVFVAKLNSSGVTVWTTFMGSAQGEVGKGIALDGSGNVYVVGSGTTTWGSPVNDHAGDWDAFVAKLNNSGVYQWNTFMGSSGNDRGDGIAVDGSGTVYVTGWSYATWGSPVNDHTGENYDAFVAKLDSSGVSVWNTFMGSSSVDLCYDIAADEKGNVYVTGYSDATWGSPVNPYAANKDAFVAKLKNNGVRQWHTFMGSMFDDEGWSIDADGKGNIYVAGQSYGNWGSPVNPFTGLTKPDAFAAKLSEKALTPGIPMLLLDSSDE